MIIWKSITTRCGSIWYTMAIETVCRIYIMFEYIRIRRCAPHLWLRTRRCTLLTTLPRQNPIDGFSVCHVRRRLTLINFSDAYTRHFHGSKRGLLYAVHSHISQSLSNFYFTLYNCNAQTNINRTRACVRVCVCVQSRPKALPTEPRVLRSDFARSNYMKRNTEENVRRFERIERRRRRRRRFLRTITRRCRQTLWTVYTGKHGHNSKNRWFAWKADYFSLSLSLSLSYSLSL